MNSSRVKPVVNPARMTGRGRLAHRQLCVLAPARIDYLAELARLGSPPPGEGQRQAADGTHCPFGLKVFEIS